MHKLPTVEAAGSLTIDKNDRILFIFKDGKWDLPKGLIDRGRSAAKTALQETCEETGLKAEKLRVLTELIQTVHLSKFAKTKSLKETRWFLLRYSGSDASFSPQRDEGIEHCAWIPLWDLERPLGNCPARINYLVNFWLKLRKELDY
ncbi:NUDIX domain-containing protein [Pelagicoccus sp. SDUM812005]|uniref:NUDIX domain-containing protein n=1 Tax=Pelagicoccus sp. SDUM812005 TaxID=3041257 RepID=UPI00280FF2E9|nr:NUDIX domain-containing protein [Pelagicoccus sp. SDUM812005]MDQ8179305.1 NUDIX domain-containing protein [Pelagicoccus sp. SDUM812005]